MNKVIVSGHSQHLVTALVAIVLMVIPLVAGSYHITVMVDVGFYSIITMGLIILMGFAGQISLGQAIFFGLGAYASGVLTTQYHFSPWLALLLAAVITGSIAGVIGRAMLRLRGVIVVGVTLALNLVFYYLVIGLSDLTGGASGMINIPRLPLGGLMPYSLLNYYLVWILALLLLVFSLNLVNSRTGRALKSMNLLAGGSEETAQALGVDVMKYKVLVFALSAIYASIAGSIYAHYVGCIEPDTFSVPLSVTVMIMAILGGMTSPWGAFLGAGLMIGLTELLREFMPLLIGGPTGAYELIAYGVILVVAILFLPQGLVSICRKLVPAGGHQ
jgi:branched-chain amino acid transport system permease protein